MAGRFTFGSGQVEHSALDGSVAAFVGAFTMEQGTNDLRVRLRNCLTGRA